MSIDEAGSAASKATFLTIGANGFDHVLEGADHLLLCWRSDVQRRFVAIESAVLDHLIMIGLGLLVCAVIGSTLDGGLARKHSAAAASSAVGH